MLLRDLIPFQKRDDTKAGVLDSANATNGNKKMSPDQFKQWLTDEYYRNMAMSFATMRKKRSILDQAGGEVAPPNRDEEFAFEKLRLMEESLLQDALQDIIHVRTERKLLSRPSTNSHLHDELSESDVYFLWLISFSINRACPSVTGRRRSRRFLENWMLPKISKI